jgi:D-3-phosphoglycerate dehydrogenase
VVLDVDKKLSSQAQKLLREITATIKVRLLY